MNSSFTAGVSSPSIQINANFSTNNKGFSSVKDEQPVQANDYEELDHKPSINGVILIGDKTHKELNIDIPVDNAQLNNGAGYQKSSEIKNIPNDDIKAWWKTVFG